MSKIFISYNYNNAEEQSLALRLQTLSSLYDMEISLPDRYGTMSLKPNTQERIKEAELFVLFSTTRELTKVVLDEITYALKLGKKVLIINNKHLGKNPNIPRGVIHKEFDPNEDSPDKVILEIQEILQETNLDKPELAVSREVSSRMNGLALGALLLIGLGLLIFAAIAAAAAMKNDSDN